MSRRFCTGLCLLTIVVCLVLSAVDASAIPAFARKYGTSCATCHQAYPRLNGVGEAFRLAGFRFVDDDLYRKSEPVEMGDEAYKRLWPKALWPTDLPRQPPISFVSRFMAEVDVDGSRPSTVTILFPEEVELVWAGTLGKNMSFYGDVIFLQKDFGGSEPDSWATLKAWVQFQNLFGVENGLNLRVGTVGTQSMGLFTARDAVGYGTHFYLYTTWAMPRPDLEEAGLASFDGNNFNISPQMGLEINGFGKRWSYAFGVVNGNVDTVSGLPPEQDISFFGQGRNMGTHDLFLQLAYKFGGIPFDRSGEEPSETLTAPSQFWRDDHVMISLFGYTGTARIETVDLGGNTWSGEDDFWRLGFGILGLYKDVSISGMYMLGNNENPYGNLTPQSVESRTWHFEVLGFPYPWLIPYGRYEGLELDMPEDVPGVPLNQDIERINTGVKFMIRPNVSTTVEYSHYTKGAELEEGFDNTIFILLALSF